MEENGGHYDNDDGSSSGGDGNVQGVRNRGFMNIVSKGAALLTHGQSTLWHCTVHGWMDGSVALDSALLSLFLSLSVLYLHKRTYTYILCYTCDTRSYILTWTLSVLCTGPWMLRLLAPWSFFPTSVNGREPDGFVVVVVVTKSCWC